MIALNEAAEKDHNHLKCLLVDMRASFSHYSVWPCGAASMTKFIKITDEQIKSMNKKDGNGLKV